jgi:hypothetical protein
MYPDVYGSSLAVSLKRNKRATDCWNLEPPSFRAYSPTCCWLAEFYSAQMNPIVRSFPLTVSFVSC